ncbi:ferritin-like domain-containing protein [Stutzerimonas azotifigens]|uniref:Ferritin-like domain-containing protein n=1 Tax=Stutzerimonas azotifigens TaxID=291995 RepID=A0ABR5Z1N1_9GAMM|nr:ferritin-like domain-containing protein [Stutzerimonas azotifigens]MBA1274057.1 ferritin-like domain-containing protein [Stutzerimonas azotifigens]
MQSAQTGIDTNDVRVERMIEWLRDAHAMEAQAESMLTKQAARIEHYPEMKARIEQHIEETRNQSRLIEQCLDRYGHSASTLKDMGGKMMAMGQAMGGMMVEDEIVKGGQMGYVFENLEIASYTILIAAAEAVGDTETKQICESILKEEEAMATWILDNLPQLTQAYLTRASTPDAVAKR